MQCQQCFLPYHISTLLKSPVYIYFFKKKWHIYCKKVYLSTIIIKLDFEYFRCEWVCPGLQCLWTWWPVHQSGRKLHLQLPCWLDGPWLSHRSVSRKNQQKLLTLSHKICIMVYDFALARKWKGRVWKFYPLAGGGRGDLFNLNR